MVSVPLVALVAEARDELSLRRFTTSNKRHTKKGVVHGEAGNKREAAEQWLAYIGEGMTPGQATAALRKNGPELGFSANEIATGYWHAQRCLSRGLGRAASRYSSNTKQPTRAA